MTSPVSLWQRLCSARSIKLTSLTLIAVVAALSLAEVSGNDSDRGRGDKETPGLEGTWLTTVTRPDGPPPFPVLLSFCAGGAVVVTDGSHSPSSGNVYQGTWAKTGSREFGFTALGFQFDAAGALIGYFRVRETLKLDRSSNAYHSVVSTVEFLDLNQNVLFSGVTTTRGTRINIP